MSRKRLSLFKAKRTDNGDLHDYALKKGNIFDNPDLVIKEDMGRK